MGRAGDRKAERLVAGAAGREFHREPVQEASSILDVQSGSMGPCHATRVVLAVEMQDVRDDEHGMAKHEAGEKRLVFIHAGEILHVSAHRFEGAAANQWRKWHGTGILQEDRQQPGWRKQLVGPARQDRLVLVLLVR